MVADRELWLSDYFVYVSFDTDRGKDGAAEDQYRGTDRGDQSRDEAGIRRGSMQVDQMCVLLAFFL